MDQSSILIHRESLGLRVEDRTEIVKASTFPDFDRCAQDVDLSMHTALTVR